MFDSGKCLAVWKTPTWVESLKTAKSLPSKNGQGCNYFSESNTLAYYATAYTVNLQSFVRLSPGAAWIGIATICLTPVTGLVWMAWILMVCDPPGTFMALSFCRSCEAWALLSTVGPPIVLVTVKLTGVLFGFDEAIGGGYRCHRLLIFGLKNGCRKFNLKRWIWARVELEISFFSLCCEWFAFDPFSKFVPTWLDDSFRPARLMLEIWRLEVSTRATFLAAKSFKGSHFVQFLFLSLFLHWIFFKMCF
jgi:hypothetical protein